MTDQVRGFYVVLDKDIRTDDVEPLMNAVKQMKHVLTVEQIITNVDDYFARQRVRAELISKIYEVLK